MHLVFTSTVKNKGIILIKCAQANLHAFTKSLIIWKYTNFLPHTLVHSHLISLASGWRNTFNSQITVRVSSFKRPQEVLKRSSLETNFGAPRLFEFPPECPNIFFSETSTTKDFSPDELSKENLNVAATGSTCLSHLKDKKWWKILQ